MAVSFKVPASPKRSIFNVSQFLGVDMTNSGTSVDDKMSPNAPNMIRDVPGKVRKRMGYKVVKDFGTGVVYGAHVLASTSTNTGDFVTNRNIASTPTAEIAIDANSSAYIYSDIEIPVGIGAHISFKYKTTGVLKIHPYIDDYSGCDYELDSIGYVASFHKAIGFDGEVNEVYNSFEIQNTSSSSVTVNLYDLMVYINSDSEDVIGIYRSFQSVAEKSLYEFGSTEHTYASTTHTLSSSSETETTSFAVNSSNVVGMVQVEFDISVANLTGATLENIEINYECDQYDGSTTTTGNISTVDYTTQSDIHVQRVIDPAYNHNNYDVDSSKLSNIVVTVTVKDYSAWSADVKIDNFKLVAASLKENYYEEGGLSLVHVGNEMYKVDSTGNYTLVSNKMNPHRSRSWQFENRLFIVDGETYWIYDADDDAFENVANSSYAHIPLMYISCEPEGGGEQYEDKNLLSNGFEQRFICDSSHSTTTQFQLIYNSLTADEVIAKVMNNNGEMVDKTEDVDFTVNRSTGIVTFNTAPGETPVTGEDNVYITAYHAADTAMSLPECVMKCTIGTLFGVNGATDRLFLSGNPDYPNVDWHSAQYDPTYFPDTSYSKIGRDTSAIIGYTLVNNYLAAHKDENETEHNVIVREGDLVAVGETTSDGVTTYNEKPAFKIINTLQGPGAIAVDTFGYLQTEPLFLTRSGIFAITAQDMTGEKYSQNRSFYINGALLEESGLENAYAITYKDMYFLFINSRVYVLDGLQALPTSQGEPYATRQYVCFYLTDIPANIAWTANETLYFGTSDGKICSVYKDEASLTSYNDNGAAISAWWETADLDGQLFYKNKTFRYIAVRLKSVLYNRVTLYSRRRGIWSKIKEKAFSNRVFNFSGLTFSTLTFNNDASEPVMSSKLRVRRIDKARFKVENLNLNEPFGLHDLALEFVENGNFKG